MHADIIANNKMPSSMMGDAQWSKSAGNLHYQEEKQMSKHAKRRAKKKQKQQDDQGY